jgi:hypothetical protein
MSAVSVVVDTNSTTGLCRLGVVLRFLVQDSDVSHFQ